MVFDENLRKMMLARLKELSKETNYKTVHYFKLKTDLMVAVGVATGPDCYPECISCKSRDVQFLEIDHVLVME